MKKQIVGIILGIALISLVSALYGGESLYGGECMQVDLENLTSLDNVVYTVVGNSSNLTGMNITLNETIANVCFVQNFKPDNFTLIFLDNSTKEVIKIVNHHHGGGTRTVCENITKFVPFETIKYVNQTIEKEIQTEDPTIEKKVNFFKRIWNWIINLFRGGKK